MLFIHQHNDFTLYILPLTMTLLPCLYTYAKQEASPIAMAAAADASDIQVVPLSWEAEKALWESFRLCLLLSSQSTTTTAPIQQKILAPRVTLIEDYFSEIAQKLHAVTSSSFLNYLYDGVILFKKHQPTVDGSRASSPVPQLDDNLSYGKSRQKVEHDKDKNEEDKDNNEEDLERVAIFEDLQHFRNSIFRYYSTPYIPPFLTKLIRAPEFSPLEYALSFYSDQRS
jgi:hypothetical protein